MKNNRKALLLLMCAVLMVTASVFGTLAYLTDDDTVTNTFTVGSVQISLDELDTDNDDNKADNVTVGDIVRDTANVYHLLPGGTYTKDPTVHVDEASESCYVFVQVVNGIANIEAASENTENGYKNIADQIIANGWTKLTGVTGVDNVYYQLSAVPTDDETERKLDLVVFENFKINGAVNNETLATYANKNVTITAYAIQLAGFEGKPADAWAAGNKPVADGGWIPANNG